MHPAFFFQAQYGLSSFNKRLNKCLKSDCSDLLTDLKFLTNVKINRYSLYGASRVRALGEFFVTKSVSQQLNRNSLYTRKIHRPE